jgi:hypothetical protein
MAFSPLSNLGIIQNLNYIANSDFNSFPFASNATLGWSLKNGGTPDATTKLPTSAPSAAAAGTLSLSSVSGGSQISGTVSASLSSTAATTAGDMLITDALTLDLKAQATIQSFSFFYKVTSNGTGTPNFSGTSANAIGVAIYDATNAAWIQPAGVFNLVQSSGVGRSTGSFQVPSNCTSVRLAVYFPNSTAASGGSPFTVIFDDFVLGPQTNPAGAAISDWALFTPTITNSIGGITNATPTGKYRRVGDSIEVYGTITFSAASAAFTEIFAGLPPGLTFDTSKLSTTTTLAPVLGTAFCYDNGTILYGPGNVVYRTPTVVDIRTPRTASGTNPGVNIITDTITNTIPITFASGDTINWHFTAPITGWSSNTVMSNDTDTRVVAARARCTTADTVSSTNTVNYDTVDFDTHGAITTSATAWKYTVLVAGYYRISAGQLAATTTANTMFVYKNGTGQINIGGSAAANVAFSGSTIIQAVAGDYFDIRNGSGTALTLTADSFANYIAIERVSGPATIAASETVAARYYTTAGNPVTNSAINYIDFATKDYDTHGMVSGTGSGNVLVTNTGFKAIIPISGKYAISVSTISATGGGWAVSEIWETGVMRNGSDIQIGLDVAQTTHNTYMSSHLYVVANLIAGDRIEPRLFQNSGATLNMLAAAPGLNNFSIVRVGN